MHATPSGYYKLSNQFWRGYLPVGHDDAPCDGWKLHISVTNQQTQQELIDLAAEFGIWTFKVYKHPEQRQKLGTVAPGDDIKNYGRTVAVYHTETNASGKTIDWQAFIQRADEIVEKYKTAGYVVRGDRKVPGSSAVYYRYDAGTAEKYRSRGAISVQARTEEIPVRLRYCPDAEQVDTDPFFNIRLNEAKHMTPDEISMFHAVYMGDVETVGRLRLNTPRLALLRDPATGESMRKVGQRLAIVEQWLQQQDQEVHQQVLDMPKMLEPMGRGSRVHSNGSTVRLGAR